MSDLDPARVEAASYYVGVLVADDRWAREAGLVCTGDGMPLWWIRSALRYLPPDVRKSAIEELPPALRARLEEGEQDE